MCHLSGVGVSEELSFFFFFFLFFFCFFFFSSRRRHTRSVSAFLLNRSSDLGRQIAINGHIKFNLTIPLQQLNGLETLVIIMVANKYAFLQITRRRFLNEWEAFKKVISRRNIRRDRKSGSAGMPRPISYAVFCLKKKKKIKKIIIIKIIKRSR